MQSKKVHDHALETLRVAGTNVARSTVPSYAGIGRTGQMDDDGIRYNWKPSNTRNLRAALALAAAGGQSFIAIIGDSGAEGFGATDMAHAWPMLLPSRWGVPRSGSGMRMAFDNDIFDSWTLPAGWANGAAITYVQANSTNPAVFAPTERGDGVVIWYFNNSVTTATVRIDGATVGTITPSGASTVGSVFFGGLAMGPHVVEVQPNSTGAFFVLGGSVLDSTGGLSVGNIGHSGSQALQWADSSAFYTIGSALPSAASPRSATFIHLGLNDANIGRTVAQMKTDLSTVIDLWNGEGDVILVGATDAHTTLTPAQWEPYLVAMYELADQWDIPLVDLRQALGTQDQADAAGLVYSDDVHYNNYGQAAYADAIAGSANAGYDSYGSAPPDPRVLTITSSATPTINTDYYEAISITALAAAITSMTTNLTGTPANFEKKLFRIKDNGTARAITWGASFEAKGVALPTTTTAGKVLTVGFLYDSVTAKWGCIASAVEA